MMKKASLLLGICILFFANQASAQSAAKDPNIDFRAKMHYSEKDLNTIKMVAPYKIDQINFMYQSSFFIKNDEGKPVQVDASKFDIYNYERFRKDKERVTFRLTRQGTYLEMMSREELNEIYTKLQNHPK